VPERLGFVARRNLSLKLHQRRGVFMKATRMLTLLLICLPTGWALAQQKVFQWLPANSESVRLDPANYHQGRVYHPGPEGGGIHVDIESAQPITVALPSPDAWNQAMQRPENLANLSYLCRQEHMVKATYTCQLPPQPMVLIIHDERNSVDRAVFA